MASNAIIDYLGNVLNSVKFAATEVLNEAMPNTKAFVEDNKHVVSSLYNEVIGLKQLIPRTFSIQDNLLFKNINKMLDNIKTDIRTGIFHHPEREDIGDMMSGMMEMMGSMFGDMPDFNDMGEDEEEGPTDYTQQPQKLVTRGDLLVASSIFSAEQQTSNCVGKIIADTHENNLKYQKSVYNMQSIYNQQTMQLHRAGYTQMVEGFNYIIKFNNEVMQTHIENSKKFFEEQLRLSTDSNAILKAIHSIHKAVNKDIVENGGEKPKEDTSDVDSVNFEELFKNGFNYNKYREILSKRWEKTPIKMIYGMIKMLPTMMQQFVTSPLHEAAKYLVKGLLGGPLQQSLKHFDQFLLGAFQTGLVKLWQYGEDNKDSILGKIAAFFGVKQERDDFNFNIDVSKYDKSAMSWNGKAQKALVEIIPSYLSRIEAAISGHEERLFDYNTGKWDTVSNLLDKQSQIETNTTIEATKNIQEYLSQYLTTLRESNVLPEESVEKVAQAFGTALNRVVENGTLVNLENDISTNPDKYGGSTYAELFSGFLNYIPKHVQMNFQRDIDKANLSRNQQFKNLVKDSTILLNLYNGALDNQVRSNTQFNVTGLGGDLTKLKDSNDLTLYDYQSLILKELHIIRNQGGMGGGNTGTPPTGGGYTSFDDFLKEYKTSKSKQSKDTNDSTDTVSAQSLSQGQQANKIFNEIIKRMRNHPEKKIPKDLLEKNKKIATVYKNISEILAVDKAANISFNEISSLTSQELQKFRTMLLSPETLSPIPNIYGTKQEDAVKVIQRYVQRTQPDLKLTDEEIDKA